MLARLNGWMSIFCIQGFVASPFLCAPQVLFPGVPTSEDGVDFHGRVAFVQDQVGILT